LELKGHGVRPSGFVGSRSRSLNALLHALSPIRRHDPGTFIDNPSSYLIQPPTSLSKPPHKPIQ
jgi:hypothetical protein